MRRSGRGGGSRWIEEAEIICIEKVDFNLKLLLIINANIEATGSFTAFVVDLQTFERNFLTSF